MNKDELKKIQNSLKEKGLIDDETLWSIDHELRCFLEDQLKQNINIIKQLLQEKKSHNNGELTFFLN